MEENPTRVCELIVRLGDVEVLGVDDAPGGPLVLHIRTRGRPTCGGCGGAVWSKGASAVGLVDLPAFGRPVRLMWHKWRWRCAPASCDVRSFTEVDEQIAPARGALTARAGRWATVAVGRDARPVADVAGELGCDWHTANRAVLAWGEALLAADCDRVGAVRALGLDETLFGRNGPWRARRWCTSIVDVQRGQLLDIVPGRDAEGPIAWLVAQPEAWREDIDWGVLDLSGAYRRAFDAALPQARQVADPFHVVRLANHSIDEVRRRVPNDTLGARGRKDDPLYRARRLLISAHERLSERGDAKLRGLLAAGDPHGEVRLAWHAKETLRGLYDIHCPQLAERYATELVDDLADADCPPELRRLGRTLARWQVAIVNWHHARVSNGPTEAINNLSWVKISAQFSVGSVGVCGSRWRVRTWDRCGRPANQRATATDFMARRLLSNGHFAIPASP